MARPSNSHSRSAGRDRPSLLLRPPGEEQIHRAVRICIGLCGFTAATVRPLLASPFKLISAAERRGQGMQHEIGATIERLENRASARLRRWRGGAERTTLGLSREATRGGILAEQELEQQIQSILNRLGIPTRENIEELNAEIEELNARVERELAQVEREQGKSPPFADYDGLNVESTIASLQNMDLETLEHTREYEQQHKNRVTVLRETDRLIVDLTDE